MKNYMRITIAAFACTLFACDDYLDREPLADITPKAYFKEESQLAAYTVNLYPNIIPTHDGYTYGTFMADAGTDNMVSRDYKSRFVKGLWKVGENGGNWSFTQIRNVNYFLDQVLPLYKESQIQGKAENINHYVGEAYFLRAFEYFTRMQQFGDFPIIRNTLPQDEEALVAASQRSPQNEVARFIISDLDSAIVLLNEKAPDGRQNRISKGCAYLLKSRVALYEGTWLKYHANTAFVPGGPDWPGAKMYPSYQFPSGSLENESRYFLEQARDAAQEVINRYPDLTTNTQKLQQDVSEPENPYFNMFSARDMSGYSEVMLWREYNQGLGIANTVSGMANKGGYSTGLSRGYVDCFLMLDGKPIYNYPVGDYYCGDDSIHSVVTNRDNRLFLFLKKPGDKNVLFYSSTQGTHAVPVEPYPSILNGDDTNGYPTGYACRKGLNFDGSTTWSKEGDGGCLIFRATEAYLNFMEASYELDGNLGTILPYWEKVRARAGFQSGSIQNTIQSTQISQEALNDWGAYSRGALLSDNVLYNIRRERRCELLAEGLRYADLKRWRSMDQLKTTPYHMEGFKLWGGVMEKWYVNDKGESLLKADGSDAANVSSKDRSLYLRPYERNRKSEVYDGYTWMDAYYLEPIAQRHFQIAGGDESVIYQNPYWPTQANQSALQ